MKFKGLKCFDSCNETVGLLSSDVVYTQSVNGVEVSSAGKRFKCVCSRHVGRCYDNSNDNNDIISHLCNY